MALAPTLLTIKNVAVGVGLAAISGFGPENGIRFPSVGAISIAGNAPTITVQLGPSLDPDVSEMVVVGQEPFLQRILVIAPGLPDAEPETNDMPPTLVWGGAAQPTSAALTIAGLAPFLSGADVKFLGPATALVTLDGLLPVVAVPTGQEGTVAPDKAEMAFLVFGLEPTLLTELTMPVTDNQTDGNLLTVIGLAPELSFRFGWTDIPVVGNSGWVDIPKV